MPKWMALVEYQISTSVGSSAGTPSTGLYCEKPLSTAAPLHASSSRLPSITMSISDLGTTTSNCRSTPA